MTAHNLVAKSVPAGTIAVPGQFPAATAPPAVFRWPFAAFCTGILVLPLSGLPADAAKLSLRWQDETARDVFTSGDGQNFEQGAIAIQGSALGNYSALQRPVADGDEWLFRVFNVGAAPIVLAGVYFSFMRPGKEGLM